LTVVDFLVPGILKLQYHLCTFKGREDMTECDNRKKKNRAEQSKAEQSRGEERRDMGRDKEGVLYGMPKTFFSFTTSPQSSFDISLRQ
jgi:hypothetical protein